jgi:hypothetical protein
MRYDSLNYILPFQNKRTIHDKKHNLRSLIELNLLNYYRLFLIELFR